MKTQYIFGIFGIAIVLAFAIIGFMGVPANADELTGDVVASASSVDTCPLANSGTCPMADGNFDDCPALHGGNCPLANSGVCPMADGDDFGEGCPMRNNKVVGSCHG
ncbi:hypothetical protein JXA48_05095 [Candidatus Woesearchaeota archaeon]|nr:hypothetical protein [Candidatus Woesearchaeota archaeon]